jgi:hypothetical protein
VAVPPETLASYVGRYKVDGALEFAVTLENGKLMLQPTGNMKFEMFPESASKFFLRAVDAQITFTIDATGRATELISRHNGTDLKATRVE